MTTLRCEKGTYALVLTLDAETRFDRVGPFGAVRLLAGHYTYIGSAHGAGGVRGRVGHHARNNLHLPHWHLDYVRPAMLLREIWCTYDSEKRECAWAQVFDNTLGGAVLVPGMGSADCEGCRAHFYYFGQRGPSWARFRAAVRRSVPGHAPVQRLGVAATAEFVAAATAAGPRRAPSTERPRRAKQGR